MERQSKKASRRKRDEAFEAWRADEEKKEPSIKWQYSMAKKLLYKDLRAGKVPLEALDAHNKSTMPLKVIYKMREEYRLYHYSKFSGRLSTLRATVKSANSRAQSDLQAFEVFKANHPPSAYTSKGYEQWQGSSAQEQLLEDLEKKLHITMGKKSLWGYRPVHYENYELDLFRDKMNQEIRTAKYLYTLKVKGKQHKSS